MAYKRLFDIIRHQQEHYPQNDAFAYKLNGAWKKFSTSEAIDEINKVSLGLMELGVRPGDKIAMVSHNRPEWNFIDLGVLQIGAVDVPVYPTISPDDYVYIFNHAEVKYCFAGDQELYDKVASIKDQVPTLKEIYSFDNLEGVRHWSEVKALAKEERMPELQKFMDGVEEEDLATLIYTSGTTGKPKGVMLTHKNIASNVAATASCLPLNESHRVLSFLPLCHSFERMVTYTYQSLGASIYYAESLDAIGDNLREVQPHFFTSVPRLLEKVYEKIMAKGHELSGIKKKLFFWAINLGKEFEFGKDKGLYGLKLKIANKLIFSKWREALGGNIIGIVTGASALQPRLERIFNAGGIKVRQGYGLTETSPVVSFNRFEEWDAKIGTVGYPIPGVEIKFEEDGELLVKGPNVMKGYFKNPDETAQVLGEDGWFRTGDLAKLVDDKYIQIVERKKELYKTSGGKYVAPQPLENKFKESPLIEQIMVVGDNRKFVSALIVPNMQNLKAFARENGIEWESEEDLLNHPDVIAAYHAILDEFNPAFSNTEQIKKFKLLSDEWTVEGGELTPTMKVKRKVILQKYADVIDNIYDSSDLSD